MVHIFWTSGWDSTYRLIELSRMPVTVEPVYCIDRGRKSIEIEKSAMNEILKQLRAKPETKAEILPIKEIDIALLPENKDITKAFKTILASGHIGSQHEWLAKAALDYPGIEIGIEKPIGALGGCTSALSKFAEMVQVNGMWKIDPSASSWEALQIFGNLTFPILGINELEMLDNIKRWGYEDVMSHIWFCLVPINGRPCGVCHSCTLKIERGMGWLLPPEAHKRYKRHQRIKAMMNLPVIGLPLRALREVKRKFHAIINS